MNNAQKWEQIAINRLRLWTKAQMECEELQKQRDELLAALKKFPNIDNYVDPNTGVLVEGMYSDDIRDWCIFVQKQAIANVEGRSDNEEKTIQKDL